MRSQGMEESNLLVVACKLVNLAGFGENDEGDFGIAEHGELLSFLKESSSPLAEGHLPMHAILDLLDLYFTMPHFHNGKKILRVSKI